MKTRLVVAVLVLMAGLLVLASGCINDNVRPVALFTVDRVDGPSPLAVAFDGSGSYDPDGTIESYSWTFGDGESGTGVTTSHTFVSSTNRSYSVTLTVTDDAGKTDSTSGSISVIGAPDGTTLFFDDFNDGLDSRWDVTIGWASSEEMLIHEACASTWAYVGHGSSWTDYIVEVDLDPRNENCGILMRCQEHLQSYVIIYGSHGYLRCRTYLDDEVVNDTGSILPGFFEGKQTIRAVAAGPIIRVYINDNLRITITDVPLLSGMPGLYSTGCSSGASQARFDNFRVTALP